MSLLRLEELANLKSENRRKLDKLVHILVGVGQEFCRSQHDELLCRRSA